MTTLWLLQAATTAGTRRLGQLGKQTSWDKLVMRVWDMACIDANEVQPAAIRHGCWGNVFFQHLCTRNATS